MLLAIEAVFCFTPLGSLPIGPMVATFAMLPVIVAAILLGTGAGTLMGFFAGLFSFLVWTFMPPPTSAMFAFIYTPFYSLGEFQGNGWSLVVCFLPRILTGTFAGLTYSGLSKALVKLRARQHSRKMTGALAGIRALFPKQSRTRIRRGRRGRQPDQHVSCPWRRLSLLRARIRAAAGMG